MIRAVIFDIDGTLVDSIDLHAQAWKDTFRQYGKDVPYEQVRHQIGKGGDQLMPVFFSKEELEEFGEEMEEFRSELFKKEYLFRVRAFPGVRELFQRLKADGKRVVLASPAAQEEIEALKKIANIEDLIEEETSADDAWRSKPYPDIFKDVLDKLGDLKPYEATVVGATPYDAEAASKLRLNTIGVLCGGFPEAELRSAGANLIFLDPADLLAHYDDTPIGQHAANSAII